MSVSIDQAAIYADALPFFKGRLDLYDLDHDGEDTAYQLWQGTLERQLSATVQLPAAAAATVRELYFQTRNHARTHGARSLGLGYPTLLCYEQARLVTAPLLIFEWQLEPSLRATDSWLVQHGAQHRVRPNEWLIEYLRARTGTDLRKVFDRAARRPDAARLQRLCDAVADALDITDRADIRYPVSFPDLERLSALGEGGALLASGTVGQFVPAYFGAVSDTEGWLPPGGELPPPPHHYAAVPLDPPQTTAVRRSLRYERTLVEGAEQSGKDRVATWLLLHAASTGQRALVVADSIPALRKLQRRLAPAGLTDEHYLIRDVADDLPQLMQVYRAILAAERPPAVDEAAYQASLARLERARARFDAAYTALRRPVYGRHNWTETVALLLAADRSSPREQLGGYLDAQDYQWTYEEHRALTESVRRCRPLYDRLGTLEHPLASLDDAIFLDNDAAEARRLIGRRLDRLRGEVEELERAFITTQDNYLSDLRSWQERFAERLEGQVDRWLEAVAENERTHGAAVYARATRWQRLTRRFRPRQRRLREVRAALRASYAQWRRMHEDLRPFAASLPVVGRQPIRELRAVAEAYKKQLAAWRAAIPSEAHRAAVQLTARQSFPALGYEAELLGLERNAHLLADRFNASGLYRAGVTLRALTVPGLRNDLGRLREQLAHTHHSLAEFRAFYNWQSVWLRQPEAARRVVRALVAAAPADWAGALDSWYLHEVLSHTDRRALPTTDELLEELVAARAEVAPLVARRRAHQRQEQSQTEQRNLRRDERAVYQAWVRQPDAAAVPVQQLIRLAVAARRAWQAVFPIVFTTPEVARTLLADRSQPFDHLLLLGADRVTRAQVADLTDIARRTTVFTSTPDDRPDSLGNALKEAGWQRTVLEEGATNPVPPGEEEQVMVLEVEGRYAERERVNEVEAQSVVQQLLRVQPTQDRRLPRVGVVCFSAAQRNLIAAHLLEIKQRNGYGNEQIGQLERNGLGLYTIDELYGIPLDVLIVSFTFGRLRHTGAWGRSMAFFDRPEATRHFNYLLRLNTRSLVLIHSLTAETIDNYLLHAVDQGSYLLAAYLRYNDARMRGEPEEAAAYRTHFNTDDTETAGGVSPGAEVGALLAEYLGADRLTVHEQLAELRTDLVVAPRYPDAAPVCLKADAYFARTPYTSVAWELAQREKLRAGGHDWLPVWTKTWWIAPRQAARKLAARLIKRDRAAAPSE